MTRSSKGRKRERDARVVVLAVEFVAYCDAVGLELRGRKAAMNEHLQDAAASVLANVGEALDEDSLGDKRRLCRYALRSAGECERLLHGLARVGAIPASRRDEGIRLVRSVKMELLRLIRWAS
jgi:four helix bundle protein